MAQARELNEVLAALVHLLGMQSEEQVCCHDITLSEYRALRATSERGLPAIQDFVQDLGVSKSGATRIIDRLEKKGYVERVRDLHDDARFCCVRLLPAGERLVERIEAETIPQRQALLAAIDPSRRAEVLDALRVLQRAVQGLRPT